MSDTDERPSGYEFDGRFYLIAVLASLLVGGILLGVKRALDVARGRDVQQLLVKANLDSDENYQRQARNYVSPLARHYGLTDKERKKAEAIWEDAMRERLRIWMDDRMKARPDEQTKRRQQESWVHYQAEFDRYLAEIGKQTPAAQQGGRVRQ